MNLDRSWVKGWIGGVQVSFPVSVTISERVAIWGDDWGRCILEDTGYLHGAGIYGISRDLPPKGVVCYQFSVPSLANLFLAAKFEYETKDTLRAKLTSRCPQ